MPNQIAYIEMKTPGAKEALAGWSYIDPVERAKWATPWVPRTMEQIDADWAAWEAARVAK